MQAPTLSIPLYTVNPVASGPAMPAIRSDINASHGLMAAWLA